MAQPNFAYASSYNDLMVEIDNCRTNYDLFRVLRMICLEYGARNFMVSEIPKDDDFKVQETLIVSNWDPELIREFDLNFKAIFIELYRSLRNSINPVNLDLPVAIEEPVRLTDKPIEPLKQGPCIFFPVYDRIGRKGTIGFSTYNVNDEYNTVFLGFLSDFVFDKFMEVKKDTNIQNNSLSDREIECLNWTALGKTSYEIGIILDISLNTVNHYLNNASKKLNCVNKTHAVAKCVQEGII